MIRSLVRVELSELWLIKFVWRGSLTGKAVDCYSTVALKSCLQVRALSSPLYMLNVAQLVEFWLVTPEVAGSKPVVQPIIYAALAQLVVRHLAMVEVTSSNLVCRSKYCRLAKLVRQRTLTPLFGSSNLSSATISM